MPSKKTRRRNVLPVAAAVRPLNTRLSRIEDLLVEMRGTLDVHLKRIAALQVQLDALTETVNERPS